MSNFTEQLRSSNSGGCRQKGGQGLTRAPLSNKYMFNFTEQLRPSNASGAAFRTFKQYLNLLRCLV